MDRKKIAPSACWLRARRLRCVAGLGIGSCSVKNCRFSGAQKSAAMHLLFPTLGRSGGRGGAFDSAVLELIPGATGGSFTQAKRTYDQQIAKITEFFDKARQYQKERSVKAPGFKTDLKLEAMVPVLEGRTPLAVSAARARNASG